MLVLQNKNKLRLLGEVEDFKMTIAILGCKGLKQDYTCPAEEMYMKSYIFSKQLEIIKKNYDKYYILSSKYGLITPHTIIEPYNLIFEPPQTNFT